VYTLPGKVANPAAWKMTLKGADGLVIVADAAPESTNAELDCISVLRGFLAAYGVGVNDIPSILQLNKGSSCRNMSAAGMAAALDLPNIQVCLSDTSNGEGVLESLSLLSREIMTRIGNDAALRLGEGEMPPVVGDGVGVSAAVHSLGMKTDEPVNGSLQVIEENSELTKVEHETGDNRLQVVMAVEGATCKDGIIRVPLEFAHAGSMCRLVVSIALDQV